ncbi:zinc-binding dehydrogenase [Paraburkholderia madseniana]|nr:zinc-binding dehydrogenase [Paraburkholderia sp. SECH4]MCX4174523.1 zinc-binding dehydrogenase [Paraburkholderia madseniana]
MRGQSRSRAAKTEVLRRFGASLVSESQDVAAEVGRLTGGRGAELVFDPAGGQGFAQLAKATANGGPPALYGALATDATVIDPFDIFARHLTVRGAALTARMRDDAQFALKKRFVGDRIADGSLRPVIARTFPLDEIADAHRFIEAREQIGKVVVTP